MQLSTPIVVLILAVLFIGGMWLIRRLPQPKREQPLTPQQVQQRMLLYGVIGFVIYLALQYLLRLLGN